MQILKKNRCKCNYKKLEHNVFRLYNKWLFEIWLFGQTKDIQKKYWDLLKTSKWNRDKTKIPKYSVLEAVIVENPDFNNLDLLSQEIEDNLVKVSDEIILAI